MKFYDYNVYFCLQSSNRPLGKFIDRKWKFDYNLFDK